MRTSKAAAWAAGGLLLCAFGASQVARTAVPEADADVRIVKVHAKKFVYAPREFTVKKGQPVVFEMTSEDFEHGFKIPDLDFRAEFVPGKVVIARLTPDKAGKFDVVCDNFCGSGHEEMDGTLVVEE
jgi:cytochrome c oxidase subunit 2